MTKAMFYWEIKATLKSKALRTIEGLWLSKYYFKIEAK